MGRYVEQAAALDESLGAVPQMVGLLSLEEGLYLVGSQGYDMLLNPDTMEAAFTDMGNQSDPDTADQLLGMEAALAGIGKLPEALAQRVKNQEYLFNMAMAENGARMYSIFQSSGSEEERQFYYDKYVLLPDGREIPWEFAGREEGISLWYGGDGYFYAEVGKEGSTGSCSGIYRISSESGETEFLFDTPARIYSLFISGDVCFLGGNEELYLYSIKDKVKLPEDPVLSEAVKDSLMLNNGDYSNGFLIAPGESEESIYLVTNKGLYHHVIGGSVMEQVIDGSLCSLGDVSKGYTAMHVERDGTGMPVFYFLYDVGKLVRFVYDETVPTLPETTLKLYSLQENRDIQLAISAYQASHPELYIQYDVGVSEEDGVTREDALKNLATALAAGEGPDILLMDGMPYASYVNKGVLMDLSGLYGELCTEGEYFDKIISCFKQDGKLYTIPMTFQAPVLCGPPEELTRVSDMDSFIEALKQYDGGRSSKAGLINAQTTLVRFAYSYGGSFLNEKGRLDEDALTEFLSVCKRALEADQENSDQDFKAKRLKLIEERSVNYNTMGRLFALRQEASVMMEEAEVFGDGFVAGGMVGGNVEWNVNAFLSYLRQYELDYRLMPGAGKVCLPGSLLSINNATNNREAAEGFVKYALSGYLETAGPLSGTPISRTALLAMEQNPYTDEQGNPLYESYAGFGLSMMGDDGEEHYMGIDLVWGTPEEFQAFNAMLDSIDSVNVCDAEVINTVLELGVDAVDGTAEIEDVVNAIQKKLQLYLSE